MRSWLGGILCIFCLMSVLQLTGCKGAGLHTEPGRGPIPDRTFSIHLFDFAGLETTDRVFTAPVTLFVEPVLDIAPEDLTYEGRLVSRLNVKYVEDAFWEQLDAGYFVLIDGDYQPSSDNTKRLRLEYSTPGEYLVKLGFFTYDGMYFQGELNLTVLASED
jgi:hypothetical protein